MHVLTVDRLRELLPPSSITLDAVAPDRDAAIRLAGNALVATGAVGGGYVDAMIAREEAVSTYIGEGSLFHTARSPRSTMWRPKRSCSFGSPTRSTGMATPSPLSSG